MIISLFNFLWTSSQEGWSFYRHPALMVWLTWSELTLIYLNWHVVVGHCSEWKNRLFLERKIKSINYIFPLKYLKYVVLKTIKLQLENRAFKILDFRIFLELVQITSLMSAILLNPNLWANMLATKYQYIKNFGLSWLNV